MSYWLIAQAIVLDIDWNYKMDTMAWFSASLLITQRRLSTCVAKRCIWIIYARRCFVRHGLTTLNSQLLHCGQKHEEWVLVFLVRMSRTLWDQNWADYIYVNLSVLQQSRIVNSNSIQGTLLRMSSNGLGNVCRIVKLLPLGAIVLTILQTGMK